MCPIISEDGAEAPEITTYTKSSAVPKKFLTGAVRILEEVGPGSVLEPILEDNNMSKAAIIVLSDMERQEGLGRVLNALEAVKEMKGAGDEVELIFDGAGTTSAVAIASPDHDLHRLYTLVQEQITGVCRYCARAYDVYEEAEQAGFTLLAEYDQHPSVRRLVEEGNEVITF